MQLALSTASDRLVADIYAAASGRATWSNVLRDVAKDLDLWNVQIFGIKKRNGQIRFNAHAGKAPPRAYLDYFRFYISADPRVARLYHLSTEEWLHCQEAFDDAYVATDPFYQDFLIPYGGRFTAGTKLIDSADQVYLLSMVRGIEQRPLGAKELPRMTQLRHHLAEALGNFVHLQHNFAALTVARELLQHFDYAMLLLRADKSIVHLNNAAEQLLAGSTGMSGQGGFLTIWDRSDSEAIDKAVHELLQVDPQLPLGQRRKAIRLSTTGGRHLLAFLSVLHPSASMAAFGHTPSILMVVHDASKATERVDAMLLAESFDLTPAEASVAVQVAKGYTAKEIAQTSKIALSTVRTHIHHLMEKAGTTKQTALVRMLALMPFSER